MKTFPLKLLYIFILHKLLLTYYNKKIKISINFIKKKNYWWLNFYFKLFLKSYILINVVLTLKLQRFKKVIYNLDIWQTFI